MATVTQDPEVKAAILPNEPDGRRVIPLEIRHRVTIEEYHRMIEFGVYPSGAPIELLEGVLVDKMVKNPPHVICTDLIQDLMGPLVKPGFFLSMRNPLTIEPTDSEPEPDASVIRGEIRDFKGRRREPTDSALVIEVSHTSYLIDRRCKWAIYGAAGVPVYWIVDLNTNRLLIFTDPTGPASDPGYRTERVLGPDDEAPIVLDGREVARIVVRDILP